MEDNQLLCLIAVLLETLPVFDSRVLIATLPTRLLLVDRLEVIESITNARHMAN